MAGGAFQGNNNRRSQEKFLALGQLNGANATDQEPTNERTAKKGGQEQAASINGARGGAGNATARRVVRIQQWRPQGQIRGREAAMDGISGGGRGGGKGCRSGEFFWRFGGAVVHRHTGGRQCE